MINEMSLAKEFGVIEEPSPEIQAEIQRLSRQPYLEVDQVKRCHAWMYELVISRMTGLLVGESRCGKTVTCKAFAHRYNKLRQAKGQRMKPVVYIQVGKNCGSRDFFIKILKALNKPSNGTISDLRERTLDSLAIHQVEMLIIDEANHLKLETFSDVRHIYDDDELKLSVLLVGTTSRLLAIVQRDEQVVNRFLEQFELDKLKEKQFMEMVQIWERDVLRLPEESKLASENNLKLLKKVTKQLIGRLDMILRKAAIRSLMKGHKKVDENVLKEVIAASKL
ncbi:TniB family NTP-binding protein [Nostoc sp. XA010]|uniref:TniB family NTP-binding protein n=1 Tax=Nostoc sp. XA010 TaxID=2780407 RepID=UPI001E626640|nr:TniB family NTP-binding protein [Nostoc sp. XA010]MCC5657153.1 TniB family NTP-binding protein [Nostoc sp. XA010]